MSISGPFRRPLASAIDGPLSSGSLPWDEGGGAPLWTPQRLLPDAWWRGSDVVVTGAGVSTLTDLSGNGNDLVQATDANRPPWVASSNINSKPALRPDGTSDLLAMTGASTSRLDFTTESLWILAVAWVSTDEGAGNGNIVNKRATGAVNGYRLITDSATALDAFVDGVTTAITANNAVMAQEVAANFQLEYTTGVDVVAAYNAATATGAGDPGSYTNTAVFTMFSRSGSAADLLACDLAECIVLARIPSAAEKALFAAYLLAEYGTGTLA